jgi:hypothetical protein
MLDQALLPERIFGLSVLDGRRTVRPGTIVRFRFRARNAREIPTPAARVAFALPARWSAVEPLIADLPPIQPGGEHLLSFAARPDVADETTALSRFQTVLHLDDLIVGSNVVRVRVTGSPRFAAPASGVRIEPASGARLRVAIDVVNDGDAAARNVRISAPPPPGFAADAAATVATTPELLPGAAFAFSYEMEPVAPASPIVRIDDAHLSFETFDGGGRAALAAGASHLLAPLLAAPAVTSTRSATRLETTIVVANEGWVPARDVRVLVEVPAGWRILRGTTLADGAPAAIRREGGTENGVAIALPFVPARGSVAVSIIASAARAKAGGALVVRCGSQRVDAPIPAPVARAVRLDARPESSFTVPGGAIAIGIDASNAGETVEQLTIELDDDPVWRGELLPGSAAAFVARSNAPDALGDGAVATQRVTARGADGVVLAQRAFDVRIVDRPWLAIEEVVIAGDQACVRVRNVGASTARDLRLAGEDAVQVATLAPGETAALLLPLAQAHAAAVVAAGGGPVPIDWDVHPEAVPVDAKLVVADRGRVGQRLDIRLHCLADAAIERLRVRPRPHGGAVYVAGSTTVNGYAIVDGVDGPPLLLGDGLALYDIPPGTGVEVAWSLVPRSAGDLLLAVDLDANGVPIDLPDARVPISDAVPFGARPNAMPFHIDAATVADHGEPLEPPALAPVGAPATPIERAPAILPMTFVLQHTLDPERLVAVHRVLIGARTSGLIGHLPAIAVLLPTAIGADPAVTIALSRANDAIRGVYERLFVKLRIPGYAPAPFDLEDNAARRELGAFLRAAAATTPLPPYDGADLRVTLSSSAIAAALDALADAPLGGAAALTTIASVLPRGGEGRLATLGAYVDLLAEELAAARGVAHDALIAYLTTRRSSSLDAARRAAAAALDAPGIIAR